MRRAVCGFLVIVVAAGFLSGCGYNQLQQQEEKVFRAWSDVESTLQRRADLIPNLVATVKGYASHEKETLEAECLGIPGPFFHPFSTRA